MCHGNVVLRGYMFVTGGGYSVVPTTKTQKARRIKRREDAKDVHCTEGGCEIGGSTKKKGAQKTLEGIRVTFFGKRQKSNFNERKKKSRDIRDKLRCRK